MTSLLRLCDVAQCTTTLAPRVAAGNPSPVSRSARTQPAPAAGAVRLVLRTGRPAPTSRATTSRPSTPVAPVTTMGPSIPRRYLGGGHGHTAWWRTVERTACRGLSGPRNPGPSELEDGLILR